MCLKKWFPKPCLDAWYMYEPLDWWILMIINKYNLVSINLGIINSKSSSIHRSPSENTVFNYPQSIIQAQTF